MSSLRFLCGVSLLFTVVFLLATRLVILPSSQWYSGSVPFRQQTDAMLRGSFALSRSPTDIAHDLAWAQGTVQQVWGLGVPFWRLPFEAGARLVGLVAFPDRFAFGVALFLSVLLLLRVALPGDGQTGTAAQWLARARAEPACIAGAALVACFPPFVTLCRSRFSVYEEAVAYGYVMVIGLFSGLVGLNRRPTARSYMALCAVAGLTPLVRPTLLAYGCASMLLAWAIARKARLSWPAAAGGAVLFCMGSALLLWTNAVRFGSVLEFGHQLNLQDGFPTSTVATRFDYPFRTAPWWSAARELLGGMFFSWNMNVHDWHRDAIFWGQSATPRIREMYLSTYDLTFLAPVVILWGRTAWRLRSRTPAVRGQERREVDLAAAWSVISVMALAAFYLRHFAITSRYLLDFAPAMAVAMAAFLRDLESAWARLSDAIHWLRPVGRYALPVWLALEIVPAQIMVLEKPVTQGLMLRLMAPRALTLRPLPPAYTAADDPARIGIPLNGTGWSAKTGAVRPALSVFVESPDFLEVRLEPRAGVRSSDAAYDHIQAKVGLEFLQREWIREEPDGVTVHFAGPRQPGMQTGLQVAFISFAPIDRLGTWLPPYRLVRVAWRDGTSGDAGGMR